MRKMSWKKHKAHEPNNQTVKLGMGTKYLNTWYYSLSADDFKTTIAADFNDLSLDVYIITVTPSRPLVIPFPSTLYLLCIKVVFFFLSIFFSVSFTSRPQDVNGMAAGCLQHSILLLLGRRTNCTYNPQVILQLNRRNPRPLSPHFI